MRLAFDRGAAAAALLFFIGASPLLAQGHRGLGTTRGHGAPDPVIPGTGVPQGNPPSGVASGYVWFDIVALALAPWLLRRVGKIRSDSPVLPDSA